MRMPQLCIWQEVRKEAGKLRAPIVNPSLLGFLGVPEEVQMSTSISTSKPIPYEGE